MCLIPALTAVGSALGAYSAYSSASSGRAQARFQRQTNDVNATLAERAAAEAERIGYNEAQKVGRANAAMRGEQAVALAGSGVDLTTGSARDVLTATDYFGHIDQNITMQNARQQAAGYRTEAANYRSMSGAYGAVESASKPMLSAGLSLIGSAGDVAEKWATRRVPGQRPVSPQPYGRYREGRVDNIA